MSTELALGAGFGVVLIGMSTLLVKKEREPSKPVPTRAIIGLIVGGAIVGGVYSAWVITGAASTRGE